MPLPARRISVEVAEVLRRVAERSGKPFALISDSSGGPREASVTQTLDGSGIAYLSGLRNGMTAIARWLQATPPTQPPAIAAALQDQCWIFAATCAMMDESSRFAFMASIGVPMLKSIAVASAADAARAAHDLGLPA